MKNSESREKYSGIPIDPKLPTRFDDTPNDSRPPSHQKWWHRPYIKTCTWEHMSSGAVPGAALEEWRLKWFEAWPSGIRYDVRCLDGGAWDRSTWWGSFATLDEAISCATEKKRSFVPLPTDR